MMPKKKLLALALIIMMAMGMLAGCSPVEKEYYSLLMEANNQKVYEDNGSIEFTLDNFTFDSTGTQNFDSQLVKKLLDQYTLEYSSKADVNQNVFEYKCFAADKNTGIQTPFLNMVYKNNVLYIKIDDMVNFLKKLNDTELNNKLAQIFGNAEYVTISDQELATMMPPNATKGSLFENSSQLLSVYTRFLDGLINQVYDNYQSNMITKNNDTYTLTWQAADANDSIKPLAVYTISNIDKLGTFLKAFLNGLNSQELTNLGLTPEMRGQALAGIDQMVLNMNQNKNLYLNGIQNTTLTKDQIVKYFNDSSLSASIQKNNQAYNEAVKLHVHFTPLPAQELGFTLNVKHILKPCGSIQVDEPKGTTVTCTSIEKWLPKSMNVNVDNGVYSLNRGFSFKYGTTDVRIINNQTYLPLRQIGEGLGEKIGWDPALGQAYAEQNGQRIVMTGVPIDSHIYVKLRDFEQLGFKVNWDASTRTAAIKK